MRKISINFLIPAFVTGCLLIAGCKDVGGPDTPAPELEVADGQTTLIISAEGGAHSIAYSVSNPVEGGEVEAVASEDWIKDIACGEDGLIVFNAEPNLNHDQAPEDRSSLLTVTYIYGDDQLVKKEINVIQNGALLYDFDWEMPVFRGLWGGSWGITSSEFNYRVWISDTVWSEDKALPGGTYYQFNMFGPKPEDESAPVLPAGTYVFGGAFGSDPWTFESQFSTAFRYDSEGNVEWQAFFQDGTITVSYEGDRMIFDAVLTDIDGKTHHAVYEGDGMLVDERPPAPGIGRDLDFDPIFATSYYVVHYEEEYMEIVIQFTDMEVDGNTPVPPGTLLNILVTVAYDKYGYLQTGTYEVGSSQVPSVSPGSEFLGGLLGTCAQYVISEEEYYTTFITGGSMTVEGGYGNYSIVCDFTCIDGYKVTCRWSGALATSGMPGNSSTLTGDYTLDLNNVQAIGYCWGDFYDYTTGELTGKNWFIQFKPVDGRDGFMADFVSGLTEVDNGIPSGTYTVAESQDLAPGHYLKGAVIDGTLVGTVYMGDFNENGNPTSYAPAVSGDLNITNNGDGTYHISFEFLDDKGNTWDGEWSGSFDESAYAPGLSKRTNYVELADGMIGTRSDGSSFYERQPLRFR